MFLLMFVFMSYVNVCDSGNVHVNVNVPTPLCTANVNIRVNVTVSANVCDNVNVCKRGLC